MNDKKVLEFTVKAVSQLKGLFDKDNENFIGTENLEEYGTELIHAIATFAPAHIYNELTENDVDMLEFNHIANSLIYQHKS